MMLVHFCSLFHKFVIIFLLPEILNKLFCSSCWCWRLIYCLVLLSPMIGIETCVWILIICPMRYYLYRVLFCLNAGGVLLEEAFSFWILPYSAFEALVMIWVRTIVLYEILLVHTSHKRCLYLLQQELLALEERIGSVSTALSDEQFTKCLRRSIYSQVASKVNKSTVDDMKCSICQVSGNLA